MYQTYVSFVMQIELLPGVTCYVLHLLWIYVQEAMLFGLL